MKLFYQAGFFSRLFGRPHAPRSSRAHRVGSVATIVLITIVIIGISLASYLSLVSNQNRSITRSQLWNATIPVAEAGIEEAMAHINKYNKDRVKEGWTLAADATNVVKQRILGADSKYRVYINAFQEPPLILAQGFVRDHSKQEWVGPRNVLIETIIDPLVAKVLAAKGQIDMSGSEITTDSFDSTDPDYNTGGQYDPAKNKANGDVATNSSLVNSLSVGNANIMGQVATGPGGTIYVGPDGAVGSKEFHASGAKGIEDGWSRDDMNVNFPDVQPPYSFGLAPLTVFGVGKTLGTGNYVEHGSVAFKSTEKLIVTGNAKLYVKGNLSFSGESAIEIMPGASLELYVGGPTTSIAGKGLINGNSSALSFSYFGLAGNTSVTISGDADFIGAIYAPSAALTLKGGGTTPVDFVGGAVANTIKLSGEFDFHFDEALTKLGPRRWYVPTSWNETKGWAKL